MSVSESEFAVQDWEHATPENGQTDSATVSSATYAGFLFFDGRHKESERAAVHV